MTKYYYNGKLYNDKDWDFDRKRPKTKVKAKKAELIAEPETQVEVVEAIIEEIKD